MQDDRIKSILNDVEVKAPRRVWRNVAAQLDAASGVASSGHDWMRWAGAAVAFAAIVAGVFVFVPDRVSEEPIPTYQNITVAQNAQIQEETPESEPAVPIAGKGPAAPVSRKAMKPRSLVAETVSPVSVVREEEKYEEPATREVKKKHEPDGSAAAEFERMAREDEKKFKGGVKTLYAQGSIGGNDSDISFYTNRARLSSGTSIKKTGITELGESEYGIPVSVGVGFRAYILPKFSIGAGLDYSILSRTFDGLYEKVEAGSVVSSTTGDVYHTMHYLGIPLNVYYDIILADKIKFYVYGGGEMEYCLGNNYKLYSPSEGYIRYSSPVERLQWSVGAGLGVEFKLSDILGLYLDPSAKYYFHCNQPKNIRTERPLMFNFDVGLRFNF